MEVDPELAVAYGLFSVRQARTAGHSRADIERKECRGTWVRHPQSVLSVEGRHERSGVELVRSVLDPGDAQLHGVLALITPGTPGPTWRSCSREMPESSPWTARCAPG